MHCTTWLSFAILIIITKTKLNPNALSRTRARDRIVQCQVPPISVESTDTYALPSLMFRGINAKILTDA